TVAPAARVFLGVACAALTSTLLSLLCLTVGGAPRGLETGHLPRADQRVPAGPGSGAPSLRTACQERLESEKGKRKRAQERPQPPCGACHRLDLGHCWSWEFSQGEALKESHTLG
ncbi:protein CEI, partial [Myotis lucifugus]|uniref:protein CEI n=1 Tax=Myotis lucifugus TaxID=59463 RepID=UPI0006D73E2B